MSYSLISFEQVSEVLQGTDLLNELVSSSVISARDIKR